MFFRVIKKSNNTNVKADETTRWLDGQLTHFDGQLDEAETELEILYAAQMVLIDLESKSNWQKPKLAKLIEYKFASDLKAFRLDYATIGKIKSGPGRDGQTCTTSLLFLMIAYYGIYGLN